MMMGNFFPVIPKNTKKMVFRDNVATELKKIYIYTMLSLENFFLFFVKKKLLRRIKNYISVHQIKCIFIIFF